MQFKMAKNDSGDTAREICDFVAAKIEKELNNFNFEKYNSAFSSTELIAWYIFNHNYLSSQLQLTVSLSYDQIDTPNGEYFAELIAKFLIADIEITVSAANSSKLKTFIKMHPSIGKRSIVFEQDFEPENNININQDSIPHNNMLEKYIEKMMDIEKLAFKSVTKYVDSKEKVIDALGLEFKNVEFFKEYLANIIEIDTTDWAIEKGLGFLLPESIKDTFLF